MESFSPDSDERRARVRIENGVARAEFELKSSVRATAASYLAIHDILAEARAHPETYVPEVFARDSDASEFAERGAILDLAVRMSIAENTVRGHDNTVRTLLGRAPRVWSLFREGDVSVANVRVIADLVSLLPQSLWATFEAEAISAASLAPARFKTRMRVVRERIQPDLAERHRVAVDERGVWLDRDIDGMSDFSVRGPATACERAMANVDRLARELAAETDETRTIAQLRSDVALDLLAGKLGSGSGVGVSVRLTIPVMTMLGHSDEPALLEEYGPIDPETARELAKHSPSILRILTHPITGAILGVDNPGYRPTASQQRAVEARDQQCTAPGCGKRAESCDLDHTVPWPNGPTRYENLKALCRHHHRIKHRTLWKSEQDSDGRTTWTSPTGFVRPADPPPF